MPSIKKRKLSQGEKSELKRLRTIEAIRLTKARTPLPGSRQWKGIQLRPPVVGYPVVRRSDDNV